MLKKVVKWYLNRTVQTNYWLPSGMVPYNAAQ